MASLCSLLTKRLNLGDSDEAYTLGLFHDCGIPVLMRNLPDYKNILAQAASEQRPLASVEAEHLGFTHADVGGVLSRSWHLPDELCQVIERHHRVFDLSEPEALGNERVTQHYALLKMADFIGDRFRRMWRTEQDYDWAQVGPGVLAYLGLSEPDFVEVQDEALDFLENAAAAS